MGRKRRRLTGTSGLPPVVAVHRAGIRDRDGLGPVVETTGGRLPWRRIVPADTGGTAVQTARAAARDRRRREILERPRDAGGFHPLPRRRRGRGCKGPPGLPWLIGRTFARPGRNRRPGEDLGRDGDRQPHRRNRSPPRQATRN